VIVSTEIASETAFFETEIQEIPEEQMKNFLENPKFENYKIWLSKLLHLKKYILSEKEERIFALQSQSSDTAHKTFEMLTNVDMNYGEVDGKPLTQSSFSSFMESENRSVREEAYKKFYATFDAHKNSLAAMYAGSVNQDIFYAQARGYDSALHSALFPNNVPISVYDNLISTIRSNLQPLHRYYSARKRLLKVEELRHYDVYVPLVKKASKTTEFDDAIEILREALSPLGTEYTDILCSGLKSGWCDRYENKGKRSGAFSSGAYTGYPYILMNYKKDVLRDVFTLAHEGGHSMHSYFSAKSNPFMHYDYTIFEAEVASTFNEELLFQYLISEENDQKVKEYLISTRASDILATLYRQTMFAEFEQKTHSLVEAGTPLTLDKIREIYSGLLRDYFGEEMVFEPESDLEALRIPHFYSAFYVYKYATGISAALTLANRVLNGGKTERDDYFAFLKSGGSRYPIDSLKLAGVDMSRSEPIEEAVKVFSRLVEKIENFQ
ncbi:MAG: oligoendopeptidase F, partial [Spirochaetaceae bacterium]|nr:oligoendopeptidase F [Spirochaetaceae bacterium]